MSKFLSRINVRFFYDDGTPDFETAKCLYEEFKKHIEPEYDGMKLNGAAITSDGFFYGDQLGVCLKCIREKAGAAQYQGLYYIREVGSDEAFIYSFYSTNPCKDVLNYQIDFLLDNYGYWTGEYSDDDDASSILKIDEHGNEILTKLFYTDETHTELASERYLFFKKGYPSDGASKYVQFYKMQLSDFKNMLIKTEVEKYELDLFDGFGDIKMYVKRGTMHLKYRKKSAKAKIIECPDFSLNVPPYYFKFIAENSSEDGEISFGLSENDKLYIRFDGREMLALVN